LQLSTFNFQPILPKLLGLIVLIPLSRATNWKPITIAIITME